MSNWNDYDPLGSKRDGLDFIGKLSQLQNGIDTTEIRKLLEREASRGSAKARELTALLNKYACPNCERGKGYKSATTSCTLCKGRRGERFLESEIPFKDRRNLEPLKRPCERCKGSGSDDGRTACRDCGGTGNVALYGERTIGNRRDIRYYRERHATPPAGIGMELVYNCPCNGTGKMSLHCSTCDDTGIINHAEYERELKRIEARYP